jgi:iron complex transport system permease protein
MSKQAALVRRKRLPKVVVLGFLGAALLASLVIASGIGTVSISPWTILQMAANKMSLLPTEVTWPANHEAILFQVRLPRVVAGALVGASLAAAGVLFQGLLRNPLADPYIIGTSAGAAFGATIAMLLPLGFSFLGIGMVPIFAFIGALGSVLIVYNIARVGGRTPVISLLLAGFALSALLVAAMAFMITVNDRLQLNLRQLYSFLMGGLSVSGWGQVGPLAPLAIGGIAFGQAMAAPLNAFALGDEGAAYLGVNVEREKVLVLAIGSLLTAAAVSISGLVGFVGLVVPHAMRLVLGPDHRLLLPAAALAGGAFLILSDLVARTLLSPTELPVGVVTALIGGPFFLYLLRRGKREYAF